MVAVVFASLNTAAANDDLRLVQGLNDINKIVTILGKAVAFDQATTTKGQMFNAQASSLALWNHLAESNNANVANAAKAILFHEKKSEAEMVGAVFEHLYETAASNDTSLVAAANEGLRLIEGLNDINKIVTTLGNAIADQGNNFHALRAALAIWTRLDESDNVAGKNAAKAIQQASG